MNMSFVNVMVHLNLRERYQIGVTYLVLSIDRSLKVNRPISFFRCSNILYRSKGRNRQIGIQSCYPARVPLPYNGHKKYSPRLDSFPIVVGMVVCSSEPASFKINTPVCDKKANKLEKDKAENCLRPVLLTKLFQLEQRFEWEGTA